MRRRITITVTTWLVGWAVLFTAVVPALAQAWGPPGQVASWIEVCSSLGAKWMPAPDAADGHQAPADAHPSAHGPCCLLHAGTLAPPPSSVAWAVPAAARAEAPISRVMPPRRRVAWTGAQPRAPPLSLS